MESFNLISPAVVLDPAQLFLKDLIQTSEMQGKKSVPSGHYKPSSMNCLRNMYYQVCKFPVDETKDDHIRIALGESGIDRHLRLQKVISKMSSFGFDCEWLDVAKYVESRPDLDLKITGKDEFETLCYSPKYNLSFKCDGLIKYRNELYILEIKTESLHKWIGRKGPSEDHLNQIKCYSLCLNIPKIMFIYENRDNCVKKSYVYTVEDDMKIEILNRINECNGYAERHVCPPKVDTKRYCVYCDYKKRCKGDK